MQPYNDQQRVALMNAPANKAEGWALIEIARRLDGIKDGSAEEIKNVLRLNWRVWTIIQAAMIDPNTEVPIEIRSNLVNLANFIDKRTVELLAKPDPNRINVLIEINRQIGAGLMGQTGMQKAEDEEEDASVDDGQIARADSVGGDHHDSSGDNSADQNLGSHGNPSVNSSPLRSYAEAASLRPAQSNLQAKLAGAAKDFPQSVEQRRQADRMDILKKIMEKRG